MLRYRGVNSDTKVLLSAIFGSAVAVIAVVVTLLGGVRTDIRDLRVDLREMRSDMREDHAGFDTRLRNVEIAFGKVDQRLLTIERVVLPSPDADE